MGGPGGRGLALVQRKRNLGLVQRKRSLAFLDAVPQALLHMRSARIELDPPESSSAALNASVGSTSSSSSVSHKGKEAMSQARSSPAATGVVSGDNGSLVDAAQVPVRDTGYKIQSKIVSKPFRKNLAEKLRIKRSTANVN